MPLEVRLLDTWHGEGQPKVGSLFFLIFLFFLLFFSQTP